MIKSLFVGRRAPGRSHRAAMRHLLEIHGPMVVSRPANAGPAPAIYIQNHVFDGSYPEHGDHAIERDLVTEFWFESVEDMRASGSTPYYLANMKPDEPRFVTPASVAKMRVAETMVLDRHRGDFKLFLLASRVEQADDESWAQGCAAASTALAEADGVTAVVRNDMIFPIDETRFVDVVLEAWLDGRAAAAALLDHSVALLAAFGTCLDPARSLVLTAEQFTADRIRMLVRPPRSSCFQAIGGLNVSDRSTPRRSRIELERRRDEKQE